MQLWEAVTGSVTAGALDSGILEMGITVEVSNAGFLLDELSKGVGTSSRYGGPLSLGTDSTGSPRGPSSPGMLQALWALPGVKGPCHFLESAVGPG